MMLLIRENEKIDFTNFKETQRRIVESINSLVGDFNISISIAKEEYELLKEYNPNENLILQHALKSAYLLPLKKLDETISTEEEEKVFLRKLHSYFYYENVKIRHYLEMINSILNAYKSSQKIESKEISNKETVISKIEEYNEETDNLERYTEYTNEYIYTIETILQTIIFVYEIDTDSIQSKHEEQKN